MQFLYSFYSFKRNTHTHRFSLGKKCHQKTNVRNKNENKRIIEWENNAQLNDFGMRISIKWDKRRLCAGHNDNVSSPHHRPSLSSQRIFQCYGRNTNIQLEPNESHHEFSCKYTIHIDRCGTIGILVRKSMCVVYTCYVHIASHSICTCAWTLHILTHSAHTLHIDDSTRQTICDQ